MTRQLVIGIVALARSQTGKAVFLLLAVDQTANGIIGVQVGYRIALISFRQAVKLAFTVVDIGQDPAIIVGSRFRPPQLIIGVTDHSSVSAGLLNQLVNAVVIDVCGQSPAAYLGGEHIAKTVVGEAVGLTFPIVGSLDGGQLSLIISILHGSGICNDYNQKKCPGKIQDTSCGGWNLQ